MSDGVDNERQAESCPVSVWTAAGFITGSVTFLWAGSLHLVSGEKSQKKESCELRYITMHEYLDHQNVSETVNDTIKRDNGVHQQK